MAQILYNFLTSQHVAKTASAHQISILPPYICQCNRKWGLPAHRSKANKEARLVERKVCFILDVGNWVGGGQTPVQRLTPPNPDDHGARGFIGRRRGPHAETAQSALTVTLKLVMGCSEGCHLDCFKYS